MTAEIIDGKALAATLRTKVARHVDDLKCDGIVPGLAVVLVGQDPASEVYVRSKRKLTEEVGMRSFAHTLPADTSERALLGLVDRLNGDPAVHGILVQLPLPRHVDARLVINAIDPTKDVDGFHASNVGLLGTGQKAMVPCTPLGCLMMLRSRLPSLKGLDALVVGRSNIVGKPMAALLIDAGCTVTVAHSLTRDLPGLVGRADVLVAAVGRPELIQGAWIKPGAVVIDVGINRVERNGTFRLVGDVDTDGAAARASAITPVPGGVGPMTIACLLANTVVSCCRIAGRAEPEELCA